MDSAGASTIASNIIVEERKSSIDVEHISNEELAKVLNKGLSELESRYTNAIEENEKSDLFLLFLTVRSKIFFFSTKIMRKSTVSAKYTPDRGNQLHLALLFQEFQNMEIAKQKEAEAFVQKFYKTCKCKKICHQLVDFSQCLKIFQDYSQMDHQEHLVSLGALTQNMQVVSRDERSEGIKMSYKWKISDVFVCRDFFQ